VSADHGVDISFVGSQRIVRRQDGPSPTAASSSSAATSSSKDKNKDKSCAGGSVSGKATARVESLASSNPSPRSSTSTAAAAAAAAPVSATRRAAEAMSLTMLTGAMKSALGLSPQLTVTETVSNACAELGVAPSGNVKADAVSCFLALPAEKDMSVTPRDLRPVSGAGPGAEAGPVDASLVARVRAFYQRHNPDKTESEIDGILQYYAGREKELIRKLEAKYSTTFEK